METRIAMGKIAVNNIVNVLSGRPPETCVNPEVLSALTASVSNTVERNA
jgi:hypothetical protein